MDPKFNFSRDFPERLAVKLLQRLELGARTEVLEETASAPPVSACGWGRFLIVPDKSLQGQIGTFGTCDALRSIERIQAISKGYQNGSRAVPSGKLQRIYLDAQKLMLGRCAEFLNDIEDGVSIVSTPRLATLLSTLTRTIAPNNELLTRVVSTLQRSALSTDDHPGSIAWPWYLAGCANEGPAELGPTALLLGALLAIEPLLRAANSPSLEAAVSLIDSSANYVCSTLESKYPVSIEEVVVCMSALRSYHERSVPTLEPLRRRASIVYTRQQILAEEFFEAFASQVGLSVITLKSGDRNKRVGRQLSDATYDIFLHGPLISTFFVSPNPSHYELASVALRQALTALATATNTDEPISTHWLGSVIDALPTPTDILSIQAKNKRPFVPFRRFVIVPDNRVTFLVLSDTQFGKDSTANRPPIGRRDSFVEVKPRKFEDLTQDAAKKLAGSGLIGSHWSGILHLGDVVCQGDYVRQEMNAVKALRDSAANLGVPAKSLVVCPGNHDQIRSSLIKNVPRVLLSGAETPHDPIALRRGLVEALREEMSFPVLARPGFGCFRDMYSHLVERQIVLSEDGVEVVSFLAPRITVHVVSLWPLVRNRIDECPKGDRGEQYGLSPRAHQEVREFLKTTAPNDVVLLLTHIPPKYLVAWSDKDADRDSWLGPPVAEDMTSFLQFVLDEAGTDETQPSIHLILSGHIQDPPTLAKYHSIWSYTAGAFYLHSDVSKGTFAARVSIDEGAVRIDSVGLDSKSITSPKPTIIAIGNEPISSESYDAHVLSTYDTEAEQFIKATDVPGKYVELEKLRERFASLIIDRFAGESRRVLEVGAGGGRDSAFFLAKGFYVDAVEGAPRLATALRARFVEKAVCVHEVNIVKPGSLEEALKGQCVHGIWMCASLLHIPSRTDLATGGTLVDCEIIKILSKHLLPGGILYVDNKLGIGAHYKERGNVLQKRWFRYRAADELEQLVLAAGLNPTASNWYNGTNGFDAWIWLLAEKARPMGERD